MKSEKIDGFWLRRFQTYRFLIPPLLLESSGAFGALSETCNLSTAGYRFNEETVVCRKV